MKPKIVRAEAQVSMSAVDSHWPMRTLVITIDFSNSTKLTTDFSGILDKLNAVLNDY